MKPDAKQLFFIFVQNLLVENKVYWLYRAYFTHTTTEKHTFFCFYFGKKGNDHKSMHYCDCKAVFCVDLFQTLLCVSVLHFASVSCVWQQWRNIES